LNDNLDTLKMKRRVRNVWQYSTQGIGELFENWLWRLNERSESFGDARSDGPWAALSRGVSTRKAGRSGQRLLDTATGLALCPSNPATLQTYVRHSYQPVCLIEEKPSLS